MDESKCKICGDDRLAVSFHTARCSKCGVLLYYPYPAQLKEVEVEEAGKMAQRALKWYSRSSFYNHMNFTSMLRYAMDESHKGRELDILDYGGGGGQFALVCKSHFPEARVYITDISDHALLPHWRPLNHQIPFADFPGDTTQFDFIFLNDVFEHVGDPAEVLRLLAEKLKPNGRIFVDTPKQFWLYPATRALAKPLHQKLLKGTVSTQHLQIWTRESFQLVVKQAGLRIGKYKEASEYTMPASYYLNNMGISNPLIRLLGALFYGNAKYLAKNKIISVLEKP